jgi:CDP-diacylglycerol--glycerol-3-phosphate 3-phosphatidyltransferase
MSLADQLTLTRAAAVPLVVVLFVWDFPNHDWWATGVFIAAMSTDWLDGRIARRTGHTSPLGSLLDPVADKLLVLTVLIVLIDQDVFPGWMVAAIVAREFLVSGLRLAALERGVVMQARDLGKLKTWSQATAAAIGGSRPPEPGTTRLPGGRCSSPSCSRGSRGWTTPGWRPASCEAGPSRPKRVWRDSARHSRYFVKPSYNGSSGSSSPVFSRIPSSRQALR